MQFVIPTFGEDLASYYALSSLAYLVSTNSIHALTILLLTLILKDNVCIMTFPPSAMTAYSCIEQRWAVTRQESVLHGEVWI